jgi:hypothetical protein
MHFYHKTNTLFAPSTTLNALHTAGNIEFFPSGLGRFGSLVLQYGVMPDNINMTLKELIWEWVRQKEYPEKISRMSCLFGVAELNHLKNWEHLEFGFTSFEYVYEVKTKSWSFHDACWLDCGTQGLESWAESAKRYWSGEVFSVEKALFEVLMAFPVKFIRNMN